MVCPRPHNRPGQAGSRSGVEDIHCGVGETNSKLCPYTPALGLQAAVLSAPPAAGQPHPGQHSFTSLLGS